MKHEKERRECVPCGNRECAFFDPKGSHSCGLVCQLHSGVSKSYAVKCPRYIPACPTCDGRGEVGGITAGDPGGTSEPCPDCNTPLKDEPKSAVCAHGSLRRSCEICERDARIADLERDVAELRALFEMQHKRSQTAQSAWQADMGESCFPDLGELLRYLLAHRTMLRKLFWVLKNGQYGEDVYADCMEAIEDKTFLRKESEVAT